MPPFFLETGEYFDAEVVGDEGGGVSTREAFCPFWYLHRQRFSLGEARTQGDFFCMMPRIRTQFLVVVVHGECFDSSLTRL